jgi:hypothetical protein
VPSPLLFSLVPTPAKEGSQALEDNLGYMPTLGSGGFNGGTLPHLEEESKVVQATLGGAFEGGNPSTLEELSTSPLGLLGGDYLWFKKKRRTLFNCGSSHSWSKEHSLFTIIIQDLCFNFCSFTFCSRSFPLLL